jgi:outer membrane protein
LRFTSEVKYFLLLLFLQLLSPIICHAFDLPELPNFAGVGVGSTTECSGCADRFVGVLPGVRYVDSRGGLFEWYGPYAQYNFGELSGFQWGPSLSLRMGRSDVTDAVIDRLHSVPTTIEGGVFVGYEKIFPTAIPLRVRFLGNISGDLGNAYDGLHTYLNSSLWVPLSPSLFVGAGLGFTWASESFMNAFYGVTEKDSTASGLPAYSAAAGLQQVYDWLAVLWRANETFYFGAGYFVQHLTASASASPIIIHSGAVNQITYGAAIGWSL